MGRKPNKILNIGEARSIKKHDEYDISRLYKYELVQSPNGNKFYRVYTTDDWGREEHYNFPGYRFREFFKEIQELGQAE